MKIIVFDLDDTLYKEKDYLESAYKEIACWIEQNYDKKEVYKYMLSCYQNGQNVFESLINRYCLPIDIDFLLGIYREHFPEISLTDEVKGTLKQLKKNADNILGIITDGRIKTQQNKIAALELEQFISMDNCMISESVGASKPSMELYTHFLNKYGLAHYYYIGDNVLKDFISPNLLEWTTICLKDDGRNIHQQIPVNGVFKPDFYIRNFSELVGIIQ